MYRFAIISLLGLCQIDCVEPSPRHDNGHVPSSIIRVDQDTTPKAARLEALGITTVPPQRTYLATKSSIVAQIKRLQLAQVSDDSLSNLFTQRLLNEIIPYWYGTPWSFEGHTEVPKQGEIACGYFVSTTLRDMGLNVNRYKLAQQSPINEAQSLLCGSPLLTISGSTTQEIIDKMKEQLSDGIHFIGLNRSHVGFLLKRGDTLLFIHSVYIESRGVDIEFAAESEVFGMFSTFYISPMSQNMGFIRTWKTGKEVKVVTQ